MENQRGTEEIMGGAYLARHQHAPHFRSSFLIVCKESLRVHFLFNPTMPLRLIFIMHCRQPRVIGNCAGCIIRFRLAGNKD
jgi:hypothetical protein